MRSHNVPALRLEGFDGEWEIANLGELTAIGGSGGTPSSGNPEYYGGDIPFLAIADIEQRVVRRTAKTLTEKGLAASAAWLVPKGSLTLAMYASVGRVAIVGVQLATSQAFYNMTFSDQALRDFIYARLNRMEELDEWKPYISTGTQQNLNAEKVTTLRLSIPSTLEEQQAIGAIFTNLDAAINQHTKKHQALQQAKTALMQRMFPQEGQTAPELRLEGFDGEWAMVRLGSIADMYQPHTISGEELQPSGIPVFGANGFIGFYHSANHQNDQVTISARGEKTGTPSYVPGPSWITGNSMVVNVDYADIDKRFLYADLGAMSLKKFVTGGAQPQLTREVLNEVEAPTPPTLEEQQAIGAVFTRLDTLIATEAKYIESLKQAKSALLQRMFI